MAAAGIALGAVQTMSPNFVVILKFPGLIATVPLLPAVNGPRFATDPGTVIVAALLLVTGTLKPHPDAGGALIVAGVAPDA